MYIYILNPIKRPTCWYGNVMMVTISFHFPVCHIDPSKDTVRKLQVYNIVVIIHDSIIVDNKF